MRPRPTAWPASGSMPGTHPRTPCSTPRRRCRRRWPRSCSRSTATCSCCPTTTSRGWGWRSSRRCAPSRRRHPASAPAVRRSGSPAAPADPGRGVRVATLAFDSARYVGARIGIFDPSGRKVGRVSHLSNQELVVIAGEPALVRRVVEAAGADGATMGAPAASGAASGRSHPTLHPPLHPARSPRAWWIGYNRRREQARSRRPRQRLPRRPVPPQRALRSRTTADHCEITPTAPNTRPLLTWRTARIHGWRTATSR